MRMVGTAEQLLHLWQAIDLVRATRRQPWLVAVALLSLAATTAITALVHAGVTGVSAALRRDLAQDVGDVLQLQPATAAAPCPLAARRCTERGAAPVLRGVRTLRTLAATLPVSSHALVREGSALLHRPTSRQRVGLVGTGRALFGLQSSRAVSGRVWSAHEERSARRVGVIGRILVDSLFGGRPPARVRLGSVTIGIIGVVRSGPVAPIDLDHVFVVPPSVFRDLTGPAAGAYSLLARGSDNGEAVTARAGLLRLRHQSPRRFASVTASTAQERLGDVAKLEDALRYGARALSFVLALASVVAVAALSASIARAHRRDVGILRALGATRLLVVTQGALIGGALGSVGAGAGWLLAAPAMQLLPWWFNFAVLSPATVVTSLLRGAAPALSVAVIVSTLLFARLARQPPAALL
jgi:hypothetical protein